MPGWQSEETPLETQVATLKRQKQTLEDRLTDRDNELATAKDLNRDLEKQVREANYRVSLSPSLSLSPRLSRLSYGNDRHNTRRVKPLRHTKRSTRRLRCDPSRAPILFSLPGR